MALKVTSAKGKEYVYERKSLSVRPDTLEMIKELAYAERRPIWAYLEKHFTPIYKRKKTMDENKDN